MYYIGVDLGGTNIAVGIVNENGELLRGGSVPTGADREADLIIKDMAELCKKLIAEEGLSVADIEYAGIATPGSANSDTGVVAYANNLPFLNYPLAAKLQEFLGVKKVLIENDANAAAKGEAACGAAKGFKDSVMITLGTGLGGGIIIDGKLYYGRSGFAGEFGHVIVERDGRECGCGRKGCLETYVSATGIKRTAFELMAKMSAPSKLRDIAFGDFDASMISAAAEQGDPIALEAFRFTGEMLGRALADVVTVTSPEAIFLFGGLSKAGKLIFEPTQWYMEESMLFVFKNKVKLLPSGIQGKNAAILGASALIWQEENK